MCGMASFCTSVSRAMCADASAFQSRVSSPSWLKSASAKKREDAPAAGRESAAAAAMVETAAAVCDITATRSCGGTVQRGDEQAEPGCDERLRAESRSPPVRIGAVTSCLQQRCDEMSGSWRRPGRCAGRTRTCTSTHMHTVRGRAAQPQVIHSFQSSHESNELAMVCSASRVQKLSVRFWRCACGLCSWRCGMASRLRRWSLIGSTGAPAAASWSPQPGPFVRARRSPHPPCRPAASFHTGCPR